VSNRVSLAELEPAAVEPPVASGDLPQDLHRAQVDLGVALATHQRERAVHGQQVRAFERRIDELSGELASARAQLTTRDDAAQRLTEATAMIRALEIIRDSQLELLGRADAELSQVRAGRDGAQEALRRVQADLQQLEQRAAPWDAAQTSKLTPASALALAEVLFADDLVVTKAARKAAHRSPFRDGHLVFEVLALLALHAAHGGDATSCVQQALGNKARWRSKDSKETVATFRSERTVTGCDGARSSLRTHVTLGHGPRADACLQIYYQLDAQGRVEVQHCGEHKCTVSHDT
jgi:hypothetical protein